MWLLSWVRLLSTAYARCCAVCGAFRLPQGVPCACFVIENYRYRNRYRNIEMFSIRYIVHFDTISNTTAHLYTTPGGCTFVRGVVYSVARTCRHSQRHTETVFSLIPQWPIQASLGLSVYGGDENCYMQECLFPSLTLTPIFYPLLSVQCCTRHCMVLFVCGT